MGQEATAKRDKINARSRRKSRRFCVPCRSPAAKRLFAFFTLLLPPLSTTMGVFAPLRPRYAYGHKGHWRRTTRRATVKKKKKNRRIVAEAEEKGKKPRGKPLVSTGVPRVFIFPDPADRNNITFRGCKSSSSGVLSTSVTPLPAPPLFPPSPRCRFPSSVRACVYICVHPLPYPPPYRRLPRTRNPYERLSARTKSNTRKKKKK